MIAASMISSTVLTTPGMAESGHCTQHLLQPVHLSGMNCGTSWRTDDMSRIVEVAAGIALMAVNGSASTSFPVLYSEQT